MHQLQQTGLFWNMLLDEFLQKFIAAGKTVETHKNLRDLCETVHCALRIKISESLDIFYILDGTL